MYRVGKKVGKRVKLAGWYNLAQKTVEDCIIAQRRSLEFCVAYTGYARNKEDILTITVAGAFEIELGANQTDPGAARIRGQGLQQNV